MSGLYIHIPFCKSRCIYCGFYSTTALALRQSYTEAVCKELALRRNTNTDIATIYLGGGTPSQLSISQLRKLFEAIYIYNNVADDAEVTMECNPDDITPDFAEALRLLPVNRVSMGAQTFSDERLQFLHRRHSAAQVSEAVSLLRNAGITNISIDLMYGFPDETIEEWENDITHALSLDVEHISCYCLMIEEGTPLYKAMAAGPAIKECDEELERQMYETLISRLENAGYEHYEISNFARQGFRSRHNSSYWDGTPYIGIGAAAHSYDIRSRSWNTADIRTYINGINSGRRIFEEELIDEDTQYNDAITVSLRTREGINLNSLSEKHRNYCQKNAIRFIEDGLLTYSPDHSHMHLTRRGLFVSDMIMSELMFV